MGRNFVTSPRTSLILHTSASGLKRPISVDCPAQAATYDIFGLRLGVDQRWLHRLIRAGYGAPAPGRPGQWAAVIAERILMGLLIGGIALGCGFVLYPFFLGTALGRHPGVRHLAGLSNGWSASCACLK